MTGLLPLLSLVCVTALVGTVCVFVHRLGVLLRAAEDSVRSIEADTHAMLTDGAVISPSIDAMNQNLYRVAMHLGQLGEAAENLEVRLSCIPRALCRRDMHQL